MQISPSPINNCQMNRPAFGLKIVKNEVWNELIEELKLSNTTPQEINYFLKDLERNNDRTAVLELHRSKEYISQETEELNRKTFHGVLRNDIGNIEISITSFNDKYARKLSKLKYDLKQVIEAQLMKLNKNRIPTTPGIWDKIIAFFSDN